MSSNQTQPYASAPASEGKAPGPGLAHRASAWNAQHPVMGIILVSIFATILSSYPIVFCGRSYVSPACVGPMVYSWQPTLPGMAPMRQLTQHGSDTAAIMMWGVPVGFIESRSLLHYGELPLWNRYSHAGDTLIGQAVSMFGDPLQLIVIIGRGSAVAWDIKYLAAKSVFCIGFGLLILRLLASGPLSLIYAALAAYCGAFFYTNNHPVFFVFSYAPWILLSALALLDRQSGRYTLWGLVWLLVNFGCFNAGHIEAAVVLIGGLNLAAVAGALAGCLKVADAARVLGRMAVGTLLFLGLSAPLWMSFLGALEGAYTIHTQIQIFQLPFRSLLGAFDDVFHLLLRRDNSVVAPAPGTSLLVLVGCVLAVSGWQRWKREPFWWINGGAIILWGGCVFGWVPASILAAIPLLNLVGHTHTDFSYLLVIHLTIQSAYGFKHLAAMDDLRRTAVNLFWAGAVIVGLTVAYSHGGFGHHPIPWNYFFCVGAGALGAPLLFVFLKSRRRPITTIGWAGVFVLGLVPQYRFGLYSFGNEQWLMIPGPRAVLNAPSRAIDKIKLDHSAPFRVVGLKWNFYGDYSAVYDIEDIRSCAPLSNNEYIQLVRKFPGMALSGWVIEITDPVVAHPLLNLLNVKYLLGAPAIGLQEGLGFRIADRSDFGVLENLDVWPRAFFSDRVVALASNEEFIKHLLANGKQPFIALTPEAIGKHAGLPQLESPGVATVLPATHYQLRPNSTAFDIHATSAGVVCLTEGQARDFVVTANHEPRVVLTVNRAFKGIYLDRPGDYHVEFIYRPRHWRLACCLFWLAVGGAVALAALSGIYGRGRRKGGALV